MRDAVIGVSDHSGWAVLVTVTADGTLLDRRRIELVASDLPKLPHHHEAQKLPLEDALDLIERVRVSAERHAKFALDALALAVSSRILGIAIRECPPLPPTDRRAAPELPGSERCGHGDVPHGTGRRR